MYPSKHAAKLLQKTSMAQCNLVSTPSSIKASQSLDPIEDSLEQQNYQKVVGSLQ